MTITPDPFCTQTIPVEPVSNRESAVLDERRNAPRIPHQASARLVGWGNAGAVACTVRDITEGGLYVHVRCDSNLRVGDRYEVAVDDAQALYGALSEGCYATVVRTELLADGDGKMLGAGLRFDRPIVL
ncbi:MAG: PilZ domain-containing protein [Planctomycetes bacterium]|nr:PilZ domain-containing protein [Planctomycetota bacterium]